jgi:hypothetical protein
MALTGRIMATSGGRWGEHATILFAFAPASTVTQVSNAIFSGDFVSM